MLSLLLAGVVGGVSFVGGVVACGRCRWWCCVWRWFVVAVSVDTGVVGGSAFGGVAVGVAVAVIVAVAVDVVVVVAVVIVFAVAQHQHQNHQQ